MCFSLEQQGSSLFYLSNTSLMRFTIWLPPIRIMFLKKKLPFSKEPCPPRLIIYSKGFQFFIVKDLKSRFSTLPWLCSRKFNNRIFSGSNGQKLKTSKNGFKNAGRSKTKTSDHFQTTIIFSKKNFRWNLHLSLRSIFCLKLLDFLFGAVSVLFITIIFDTFYLCCFFQSFTRFTSCKTKFRFLILFSRIVNKLTNDHFCQQDIYARRRSRWSMIINI